MKVCGLTHLSSQMGPHLAYFLSLRYIQYSRTTLSLQKTTVTKNAVAVMRLRIM
ncbi:hypothetical protein JG688_00014292 [Phytophthora aleatoria]|uniref:Uncharacterized protein n=1 Tax=Phytophthora aleatoria TaxID=2496075 RepID=A0A8J5IX94_9STRA|nr:hypothetical protein JG688_00014292 [Phytophthora aleatoria]